MEIVFGEENTSPKTIYRPLQLYIVKETKNSFYLETNGNI